MTEKGHSGLKVTVVMVVMAEESDVVGCVKLEKESRSAGSQTRGWPSHVEINLPWRHSAPQTRRVLVSLSHSITKLSKHY
jgi:hypothetical protein